MDVRVMQKILVVLLIPFLLFPSRICTCQAERSGHCTHEDREIADCSLAHNHDHEEHGGDVCPAAHTDIPQGHEAVSTAGDFLLHSQHVTACNHTGSNRNDPERPHAPHCPAIGTGPDIILAKATFVDPGAAIASDWFPTGMSLFPRSIPSSSWRCQWIMPPSTPLFLVFALLLI